MPLHTSPRRLASLTGPHCDQFVIRPRAGAVRSCRTDVLHTIRIYSSGGIAPLTTNESERAGDLLVGERGAERRHQPDGAFLSLQQNADRNHGRCKRKLGSNQAWSQLLASAPIVTMARHAEAVEQGLPCPIQPLFLGRKRRNRRRCARL